MNKLLIGIALMAYILIPVSMALRSWFLYRGMNLKISLPVLSEILMIVSAANVIAPFRAAGLVIRTYILKKTYSFPHKINLTITGIEQLFDLVAQIIVAVLCIYLVGFNIEMDIKFKIIIAFLAFLMLVILWFWKGLGNFCYKIMEIFEKRLPKRLIKFLKEKTKIKKRHVVELIKSIQNNKNKWFMILGLSFSTILVYFNFTIAFWLFAKGMSISLNLTQVIIIFWLPMFLGRVSGIPGGFGVREASMIYLMNLMGFSSMDATSLTISFRISTIIIIIVMGILLGTKYGINIFKPDRIKKENE
ncbi:flippase-like domain-containing protein [Candidatus Woesearchaeota archaeon]|nr:flippase-like domain-containing protein [Candidatus Woesearchaeota archaeon]MBT5273155.1 flippase-like domain-containing protein [Candidatus Woesearchaeota archaeon]MBT6041612.1 flippase-like domain-containing protein [Candidatus Woesearchaeota archaeon]MBT6337530.1 flippase-like domain-containing protein [Candidatus Woesearchaeota archaeon]MBT7927069.1 flippase-like domain-containing protein [Candidatus Woesearchaeota archaeon]